jgi:hypothetical protein
MVSSSVGFRVNLSETGPDESMNAKLKLGQEIITQVRLKFTLKIKNRRG